jgi:ribosomal protein L37AE/L43A
MKQRLRKFCPKCNRLNMSRAKSSKKYKCHSCKAEFETPRARVVHHREIALRIY